MWVAKRVLCFALAAMALSAPAFGQLQAPPRGTLGEGDSVRITVFQNPDLTTEARVSERGTIGFPLIGAVEIGGLTPEEAQARIAQRLVEGKFVLRPQVSLNVLRLRSRQVSVLGEVARPGRYALDDVRSNLTDVLALAGGIGPGGDDRVTVIENRQGKTLKIEVDVAGMYRTGDMSRDIALESGDTVYVPRAPQFYIYGEVQRAGAYRLAPAMTVQQALSVGGGITPRGTQRGLEISRATPDGQVRRIDARLTDKVLPGDVIRVAESLF